MTMAMCISPDRSNNLPCVVEVVLVVSVLSLIKLEVKLVLIGDEAPEVTESVCNLGENTKRSLTSRHHMTFLQLRKIDRKQNSKQDYDEKNPTGESDFEAVPPRRSRFFPSEAKKRCSESKREILLE